MELVGDDNSVAFRQWRCLDTNRCYEIRSSTTTFDLKKPNYLDKAHFVLDEVINDRGERRKFTRMELKKRFRNIEEI